MSPKIAGGSRADASRILGIGTYRPMRVVTNDEICAVLDSTPDWIESRSGIRSRRFAGPDETLGAMATTAAGKALAHAGIEAADLDVILLASMSDIRQSPSTATDVARRLGADAVAAFDLSAACAGFCYALGIGRDMILAGSARYALVIGVERMTDIIDPTDRGTAFLFGDGAGAVVLGPSDTPGIGPIAWGSDPGARDAIGHDRSYLEWRADPDAGWPAMRMAGQRVYRWASYEMAPVAKRALALAGVEVDDLEAFIPHQANVRIIDLLATRLKLPAHVAIARDITTAGNTSGASIPLAIDAMLASGQVASGGLALLIGFGAGLVYAAQVVELP
jgi:3-oxoacyl-[acyl-carrier-protein] synthase III